MQNNSFSDITSTLSNTSANCSLAYKTYPSINSNITVFYSNVRSLLPKAHLLISYVSLYNPTVLAFSETWLNDCVPSSLFCPGYYTSYRDDRLSGRGGGTLFLVIKDDLTSKDIQVKNATMDTHINAVS